MEDKKTVMRMQDKDKRIKNFQEVELGYNEEEALREASRCLQCTNPRCVKGCPVNIMIPLFIKHIKEKEWEKAYQVIQESSFLPAICGRVCPQEMQCEKMCVKGFKGDAISIGALERFVADMHNSIEPKKEIIKNNGKKVAIVGSGPAGLSCAGILASNGFEVTIYEVLHRPGGVLTYGIPEFRLPKKIVEKEIENLKRKKVEIKCDMPVGNAITLSDLQKEYDYIFLGTGAGVPKFMGIPNESANEVFSANEILTRINLMGAYQENSKTPIKEAKTVYVIGGGNVAMDAARSLKRLGMNVHLMYRRGKDELPARKVEVIHALEEGIIFDLLQNPLEILTDENNSVTGMKVINMEYQEEIVGQRRSVQEVKGTEHNVSCDMVVMALGTNPNHEALKMSDIKLDDRGLIMVDDGLTSIPNVYAGGDAVTGAATVILAMEAGKKAAYEIIKRCK